MQVRADEAPVAPVPVGRVSTPILATKLAIPVLRQGLVPRRRLTERLRHRDAYRLALVVAPAGWGKTSLLSEWCAQPTDGHGAVAWLSLDAGDNDPSRFLLYVAAALDAVHPGVSDAARSLLVASQPPPNEVVLTSLLNAVVLLDAPATLVLDDYHLVESQAVHDAVTFVLDHLPANLRLVIATRMDPPLRLSRMRVRRELLEVRVADLRFTDDEAQAFLHQATGLDLDAEAIARLEGRTEGWIAGLQLAALSLQGRPNAREFLDSFTGSNRYIVDYLFDEVLDRQRPEVVDFLLRTSILHRLSGPLCDSVADRAGGQDLLEEIDAANLFLVPLDVERRWFRYHHLFGDVLRARLGHLHPAEVPELHRRAAAWFEREHMMEEAIDHALAAGDFAGAADLIEAHCEELWVAGSRDALERWILALPQEMVRSRPPLIVFTAAIYAHNCRVGPLAEALGHAGFEEVPADPALLGVYSRLAALRSLLRRYQGDMPGAVDWARRALAHMPSDCVLWRQVTTLSLGLASFEAGDLDGARDALAAAIAEYGPGADPHLRMMAGIVRACVLESRGLVREAEEGYAEALTFASEAGLRDLPETALACSGLARMCLYRCDFDGALKHVQAGLKHEHPASDVTASIEHVRILLAMRDLEGAQAAIGRIERAIGGTGIACLPAAVDALHARLAVARGETPTTWMRALEDRPAGDLMLSFPNVDLPDLEALTWALACLQSGEAGRVPARLLPVLERLTKQRRNGNALAIRAMLAAAYVEEGRLDEAVRVAEPALRLAAEEGIVLAFVEAGPAMVPVLKEAAGRGIATAHVARLLQAFREAGIGHDREPARAPVAGLPEPLSDREIEVLRLVAAGLSNPEIAEHLFLSVGTIKRHVYNIFMKLDVGNRVSAIARARELGLIE